MDSFKWPIQQFGECRAYIQGSLHNSWKFSPAVLTMIPDSREAYALDYDAFVAVRKFHITIFNCCLTIGFCYISRIGTNT